MTEQNDDPLFGELIKLQRLNKEHAIRLRQVGLDLTAGDLSDEFLARLDEYVAIQQETGLLNISDITLQQWYQQHKLEMIDLAECSAVGRTHCRRLEARLTDVRQNVGELETLLAAADKENRTPAEVARRMAKLDTDIGDSRHKLDNMQKVPEDIHLFDIMDKVKELKSLKHK